MDIQPTSPDLGLLMSSPRWLPLGSSNVLVHHCQLLAGKLIRGLSQQLHNPQIYSLDHTVLHSPPTPWFLSHFLLPLSPTLTQQFLCNTIFDYSDFLGIFNHCILEDEAASRDTDEATYHRACKSSHVKHPSIFTCLPDS